jgi:uncharacterized protein
VKLEGATALVTGATGGLGAAIARGLRARGAELVVSGRRGDVLEEVARELNARAIVADLSHRGDVERLAAESGAIDVLVPNAGLPAAGPVLEFTPEEIDRALDVNLRAPLQLVRALVEPMVGRGRGHVVFISSLAGKFTPPQSGVYSATKFGLRGLSWGLRQDLRGTGVGVSCVLPGLIRDAGMFADTGVKAPPVAGTRTPEDVTRAVVRAIEHDVAEIEVGSLAEKAVSFLGALAPATFNRVSPRFGGDEIAAAVADSESHRAKR